MVKFDCGLNGKCFEHISTHLLAVLMPSLVKYLNVTSSSPKSSFETVGFSALCMLDTGLGWVDDCRRFTSVSNYLSFLFFKVSHIL